MCSLRLLFLPLAPAGLFGLIFGLIGVFAQDGDKVWEGGILQGYNSVTWVVVILQVHHLTLDQSKAWTHLHHFMSLKSPRSAFVSLLEQICT